MTITTDAPKKRGRRKTVQSRGLCQRTFKKKDGTTYIGEIWYMRYAAPDPDHPGKMRMVFESTGKTDKAEAYEILVRRKAMVFEDRHPDLKRANENTFERFVIDDYLPYCKAQKDIKNKTNMCKNQFIPVFGRFLLKDITARMVADYIKSKEAKSNKIYGKKKDDGCTPATCNRHLAGLKYIFTVAAKAEFKVIGKDKVFEIQSIDLKDEPPGRDGALTKKQFAVLLKHAKTIPFMHQFIRFSANTGIRRGRIFRLTWSMIVENEDTKQIYINIPQDKHGDRHDAPLNDEAMKVIRERALVRQDDIPYVFWRESTRDRLGDVKIEWKIITDKAELSWYHLHDLRHTFVTQSLMSGIGIKTTQQLSGHKTNSMVSRYSHLSQEFQMHEVKKLSFEIKEKPTQASEPENALDSACL
jgi:integrase